MGAKDSKPSFISYEDAEKRVLDHELRRIREAFKRCAGNNGTSLSLETFVHEVLCDGVPFEVAEWLYQACGGTKRGITFKDLLCGIVVLTKGNREEKIKFLWTLYVNNQGDNGTYIYKRDFARSLHLENTSLPVTGAQKTAEILLSLFGSGEKVTFEQFRSWLLMHKDATVLSQWLLSSGGHEIQDLETPTFYQSLAGVTHLEERDIIELEKCFWSLRNSAPTGQLDTESLTPLLCPPLPRAAVEGVVLAFDENRDGHVDFKELCCGLSAACRGPTAERFKFCFKIFDMDRDGVLNQKELTDMIEILCTVANETRNQSGSRASTPDTADNEHRDKTYDPEVVMLNLKNKLVPAPKVSKKPMFQLGPRDGEEIVVSKEPEKTDEIQNEEVLTQEEFLLICSTESSEALASLVAAFGQLLVEVGHVVLGLRPQCAHHERDIVLGWLRREVQRGYSVGQFWYLVGAEWWAAWLSWTSGGDCCRPRAPDDGCDTSYTTSTESMGSLLWRADTTSIASASSGVGSAATVRHPGPIDNKRLLAPDTLKVPTLTGEGGQLRRDVTLAQHRDFELLPDGLWRALALWYGAPQPLPRQVIRPPNSDVELELYPLQLKIYEHVRSPQRSVSTLGAGALGGALAATTPERQLAYTACFSRLATVKQVTEFLCGALSLAREQTRLWALGERAVLLDDERPALGQLGALAQRLLLERRSPDLTWPEEMGALRSRGAGERRETLSVPNVAGATGLHNLGNTCFMNAALQAVWNTRALTQYFRSDRHLYELNADNPHGTRGALATTFGDLCKEVWSCRARSVAPLRVRGVVAAHAAALAGGGQHDAQELLAWLLDALHEDLNRARPSPPHHPPLEDSAGRPDQVVAEEAWEAFTARNQSIITDLFYGQLKSRVRCSGCGTESVRFDTFNMLSLPLPMDTSLRREITVILLDGSVPVKYAVLVNSEGTYLDLKKKLSELCGLPPESMVVAELCGARVGRVFPARARLGCAPPGELLAYELPPHDHHHECVPDAPEPAAEAVAEAEAEAGAEAEVSVARASHANSLCMPALFCFKRSRSEIVMSQSPGRPLDSFPGDSRSLPRLGAAPADSRPGDSRPGDTRSLPRRQHGSAPVLTAPRDTAPDTLHYLVAVHRKQCRMDAYFLSSQRSKPALFGVPLLVGLRHGMSGRDLYAAVWTQVARLLSAKPPAQDQPNHATDCDDSLGYEFPFTLRVVDASGAWCGLCAWPAQCRGCGLPPDHTPLLLTCARCPAAPPPPRGPPPPHTPRTPRTPRTQRTQRTQRTDAHEWKSVAPERGVVRQLRTWGATFMLAIDWEPTALHVRYQTRREREAARHRSLGRGGPSAVGLRACLAAFTADERLDDTYHCGACAHRRGPAKKMQLWRLPPNLIIHLKRFQFVNNKWIKSQKVVDFPFEDFDPTDFLATIPYETIKRHRELTQCQRPPSPLAENGPADTTDDEHEHDHDDDDDDDDDLGHDHDHDHDAADAEEQRAKQKAREARRRRARLQSSSLAAAPVRDDQLVDYHRHHLRPGADPYRLRYSLYAVVCHSGQLSGGHYVAYARSPGGEWLCYNDSACTEVSRSSINPAHAYLLFYQRQDLCPENGAPRLELCRDARSLRPLAIGMRCPRRYLPDVSGPPPAPTTTTGDLAHSCSLA